MNPEFPRRRDMFASPDAAPQGDRRDAGLSEIERARWQKGTAEFRKFWRSAIAEKNPDDARYTDPFEGSNEQHELACLEAMFMGEKPASLGIDFAEQHRDALAEHGFAFAGDYVYNPALLAKTVREHPDVFRGEDAETVMRKLSGEKDVSRTLQQGVVLGFPEDSARAWDMIYNSNFRAILQRLAEVMPAQDRKPIEDYLAGETPGPDLRAFVNRKLFQNKKRLGIERPGIRDELALLDLALKKKNVDVHGIGWADFGTSKESGAKQKRLRAAFETTGIDRIPLERIKW